MQYMGSKNRIAKHILPIMLDAAQQHGITTWVEHFVGGGNTIDKVPSYFRRIGIDVNPHTIAALIGIRDVIDSLPSEVSEDYYRNIRKTEPNPITSWIRFGACFGGKFDNGDARSFTNKGESRNHLGEAFRNAKKNNHQNFKALN